MYYKLDQEAWNIIGKNKELYDLVMTYDLLVSHKEKVFEHLSDKHYDAQLALLKKAYDAGYLSKYLNSNPIVKARFENIFKDISKDEPADMKEDIYVPFEESTFEENPFEDTYEVAKENTLKMRAVENWSQFKKVAVEKLQKARDWMIDVLEDSGLIEEVRKVGKDKKSFWTMTEFGVYVLSQIIALVPFFTYVVKLALLPNFKGVVLSAFFGPILQWFVVSALVFASFMAMKLVYDRVRMQLEENKDEEMTPKDHLKLFLLNAKEELKSVLGAKTDRALFKQVIFIAGAALGTVVGLAVLCHQILEMTHFGHMFFTSLGAGLLAGGIILALGFLLEKAYDDGLLDSIVSPLGFGHGDHTDYLISDNMNEMELDQDLITTRSVQRVEVDGKEYFFEDNGSNGSNGINSMDSYTG